MHLFKACYEDGYDKINELSNFRYGVSLFSTNSELLLMNKAQKKKKKKKIEDLELHLKQ